MIKMFVKKLPSAVRLDFLSGLRSPVQVHLLSPITSLLPAYAYPFAYEPVWAEGDTIGTHMRATAGNKNASSVYIHHICCIALGTGIWQGEEG